MLNRIRELARESRDFAFETTLASKSFAPWLNDLQEAGYTFRLIRLYLPTVELALARVAERVQRGGHAVPEAVIRRRYARSLTNFFELYSPFADSWVMLDNSVGPPPRAVARRVGRRAIQVMDASRWYAVRDKYERQDLTER